MLQAARSFGQPRLIRRPGSAGRPYRPWFRPAVVLGVERPPRAHPLLVREQRARRRRAQLEQHERDALLPCAVIGAPGSRAVTGTPARCTVLRRPVRRLPLLHPRARRSSAAALRSHQGGDIKGVRSHRDVRIDAHHRTACTRARARRTLCDDRHPPPPGRQPVGLSRKTGRRSEFQLVCLAR
jgi:hypothetical protein